MFTLLQIVSPSLAIAVAVAFGCFALCLAPYCLAAAAVDTKGLPQELLVPFNDLLPPLSDAEFQDAQTTSTTTKRTTTRTTTTTTTAAPVTEAPVSKTTTTRAPLEVTTAESTKSATIQKHKKTQYKLDQQLQKQQLAVPILDLNPEVPPALPQAEVPVASKTTEAPVTPKTVEVPKTTTTRAPPAAPTKAPVKVSEPKQAASTQHFQQVQVAQTQQYQELQKHLQPQKQQQYKLQQQQQQLTKQAPRSPPAQHRFHKPQVAGALRKVTPPPAQRNAPAATQVNVEHLQQYLEYIYHPTTRRPSRGPLPTLTPFPRHFK